MNLFGLRTYSDFAACGLRAVAEKDAVQNASDDRWIRLLRYIPPSLAKKKRWGLKKREFRPAQKNSKVRFENGCSSNGTTVEIL